MILSKSDLRNPLNPLFKLRKNIYKKLFGPIDHHAKFQIRAPTVKALILGLDFELNIYLAYWEYRVLK